MQYKKDVVLYHDKDRLRIGGVVRYEIEIHTPLLGRSLFVRVRNTEVAALRAAYLGGPFMLYVDMIPMDYSEHEETVGGAEPKYENHLKAGSHFSTELKIRSAKQKWTITIMSEILFSRSASINFEVTIGTTKLASKLHGKHAELSMSTDSMASHFEVRKFNTAALWQQPLPRSEDPLHVCVLTHGLMSNVTADMLYLKELLDDAAKRSGENLICKGYTGNVCRTEKGVKYLGKRLANWIVNELIPTYQPSKLSFIGHSLGGLIQLYALGYIEAMCPEVLKDIKLVNFIALASPFLGISSENPAYVQFALNFGIVGRTGLDLGLSSIPGVSVPLLEKIPDENTIRILRKFTRRTVYANAVNDGIVPLRTASLLYLDWKAISSDVAAEYGDRRKEHTGSNSQANIDLAVKEKEVQNDQTNTGVTPAEDCGKPERSKTNSKQSSDNNQTLGEENTASTKEGSYQLDSTQHTDSSSSMSVSEGSKDYKSTKGEGGSKLLDFDDTFANILPSTLNAKKLRIYQTVNKSDEEEDVDFNSVVEKLPKKTSLLESGMSLLMPPHPNKKFISNPRQRDSVIFHDRTYYQQDLPSRRFKNKLQLIKCQREKVEVARSEEKIARAYHSGLSWRKVLVKLLPEAHNNIIVRRRFSNAYGWPVVHHVVREHFLHPFNPNDNAEKLSETKASAQETSFDEFNGSRSDNLDTRSPWSSDDDTEHQIDIEHDPQKISMLKIIPQNK